MRIWLKPDKMASLGVSTSDINAAITSQNTQAPAGNIGVEPMDNPQMMKFTLRTKGRLKTVEEFENIIVKSNELKTEQIAQIQNITSRELGVEIDNIHISNKND